MQLTYVALALSAMCMTVSSQACTAHEDCAADQYCDQFSTCYGCMPGGCWEYLDPFDQSGTCPDKCKDPALSCQAHYECGAGEYCNDGFECTACASCYAENNGVYAWDCITKCGPAPEGTTVVPVDNEGCTGHDGCGADEYCDNFNTCYGCQGCFEYNDPIDGSCPDQCRDTTLECQNYLDCGNNEFCTDGNTCTHCINCKEGVMGPFWPCTDACPGDYATSSSSSTSTSTSTSKENEDTTTSTAAPSQSTADEKEATTEPDTTTDTNTSPKSSTSEPMTTAEEEEKETTPLITTSLPTTGESTTTTTTTDSTTTTTTTTTTTEETTAESTTAEPTTDSTTTTTTTTDSTTTTTSTTSTAEETTAESTTAEPTTDSTTSETTTSSTTTTTTSTMASTTESEDSSGESSGDSTMMATIDDTTESPSSSSSSSSAAPTCADDNCFRCDTDLETCEVCKNGKFLLEGVCVDACPTEGYTPAGRGLFRKRCEPAAACQKGVNDCHTCDESSSACLLCANGMHLLDGECVATCPYTHLFRGQGNFGRRCQPRSGTCADRKDECFECESESVCRFCKNGYGLYQGVCVPECPEGYSKAGRGNFRRTCVPTEM